MATSQPQHLSDQDLSAIVEKGYEHESWLWLSSAELDEHLAETGLITENASSQCSKRDGLAPLHEWTDYRNDHRFNMTVAPLMSALTSLWVGTQHPTERWNRLRTISPGYSVCLTFIQDKQKAGISSTLGASVDAAYNIIDGVIVIREAVKPMAPITGAGNTSNAGHRNPRWEEMYEILWTGWMKLHLPVNEHRDCSGDPRVAALDNGLAADLSAYKTGLGLQNVKQMMSWLNWIFVHQQHNNETLQVIGRCLASRGHPVGQVPNWNLRETYQVGHWAFYGLLGTEIGLQINTFLAFHKDNCSLDRGALLLGNKVIKSITIFKPNDVEGLTERERQLYASHPALLFEITDSNGELQREKDVNESAWRH